jgi:hypothetical protein
MGGTEVIDRLRSYQSVLEDITDAKFNGKSAWSVEGRTATMATAIDAVRANVEIERVLAGLLGGPIFTGFTRAGTSCYFDATGEFDCPTCGRIHTENEVLTIKVGDTALNWCPCGTVWMETTHDFQILTTSPMPKQSLTDFNVKQSYMDNNVRYLLRTTATHIGGPALNGEHVELFYHADDGTWIVDWSYTGPEPFTTFDEAWSVYSEAREAYDRGGRS